jgi:acetyl esterase/lipase
MAASVNYRLAPKDKFPAGVDDCYNAVKFLIDNAEKYSIDTDNIFIMGPSAGGSLTLITGLRLFNERENGSKHTIRALAPLCPVTDLSIGFSHIEGLWPKLLIRYMLRSYIGGAAKKGVLAPFDASYYVKDAIPPMFFQLGRHDPVVKVEYVERFIDSVREKGEVVVDILEDGYHMGATKHFFLDENILRYLSFFEGKISK